MALASNNPSQTTFKAIRTTDVWLTCEGIESDPSAQLVFEPRLRRNLSRLSYPERPRFGRQSGG